MPRAPKPIDVHFYRASVLERGGRRSRQVDWVDKIEAVGALPLAERKHEDDVYDVHTYDDMVLVGAHRVINTDFMTQIDASRGSITDLMDEAADAAGLRQFAHTTVMAFLPKHNAVAVVRGGTQSPRALSAVQTFLTRHLPQDAGATWHADPLIIPDKTSELRRAKGVLSFEGRFETARMLDDPEPGRAGLASHVDGYADSVGGELIIDVKVRIAPGYRNAQTAQSARDLLLKDLPRLMGGGKKVTARALYSDDSTEILDIIAGTLTSSIEMGDDPLESRRFTSLLEGLRNVSIEMQDEVDRLVEG